MVNLSYNLEFFTSIFALIISVCVAVVEYQSNKRLKRIDVSTGYYDEVFKEFLLRNIPDSMVNMSFDAIHKKLNAVLLKKALKDIRKKIYFLKFHNPDVYQMLYQKIQDLEDYLVLHINVNDNIEYVQLSFEIQTKLTDIYKYIWEDVYF